MTPRIRSILTSGVLVAAAVHMALTQDPALPADRAALDAMARRALEEGLAHWETSLSRPDYDDENDAAFEAFRLASRAYRQLAELAPGNDAYHDALLQANTLKYSCLKRKRTRPSPGAETTLPSGPAAPGGSPAPNVAPGAPPIAAREIPTQAEPLPQPAEPSQNGGAAPAWVETLNPTQRAHWSRATTLIAAANRSLARGEGEKAKQRLERAVRLAPWCTDGVNTLARIEYAIGRGKIHEVIRRRTPQDLVRSWPTTPEVASALALLTNHLERYGPSAVASLTMGAILEDQRRLPEARVAYSDAIEAQPDLAEAFLARGRCHMASRQFEAMTPETRAQRTAALEDFNQALALDPSLDEARARCVLTRLALPHPDLETLYRELSGEISALLDASANHALGLYARGALTLAMTEDGARAIPDFRMALERNPALAEIWEYMGTVYKSQQFKVRDLAAAEACFLEAIRADPGSFEAWQWLGGTQFSAGRLGEAINTLRTATLLRQDSPSTHGCLAAAHHLREEFRDAGENARICLTLEPEESFRVNCEKILADPRVQQALQPQPARPR